jgi:subtilisin family serine protease
MPIRFASGLGSQQEAEAFAWAADHGADVISCSWGPEDGDPEDPDDAMHEQVVALPDSTRLAMAYAVTNGRGGKGCVICFAAGNGNESVDNDGYAGSQDVIAVAACNDRGRRSFYSDFGDAVWCSFPSNDFGPPEPLTPGIWTTDRSGDAGYTPHFSGGDASGNYTDSFGGTSSACPGVAGVVALMLSRHPNLTWKEVKDRLKKACVKVDKAHGGYDGDGHSPKYGHGRVDALKAVRQAGK